MPVTKRDVTSLSKEGEAKLKGDVTLSEGTGVTITQSGQDIEIAAVGGEGGAMDDFNLDGDSGTPETIADGNTLTIAGGTGIDTTVGATDTVTVDLDAASQASLALADSALQDVSDDTSPTLGGALDAGGFDINNGGVIFLTEQADAEADVAGKGQIWVDTATPNVLFFTDDAGTDFRLSLTAGTHYYAPGGTDVALADGGTGASLADPGADRIMAWDDSAGAVKFSALTDVNTEGSPAAGDFLLAYTAEGALVKVDWDDLPAGSGISEVSEDTSPTLGGALDANNESISNVDTLSALAISLSALGGGLDMNGLADGLILDADNDTTISAPTDDQIDIEIAGADDFRFTANTLTALSGSSIATDTISETTGGSGVTVDGVLIKDGFAYGGGVLGAVHRYTYDGTDIFVDGVDQNNAANTINWTKPTGLEYVIVEVQAAGGGGGGVDGNTSNVAVGGGGHAGGYSQKKIAAASLGATEVVTVGALGAGGTAGLNDGTAGGNSSFGAHATTTGGGGGLQGAAGTSNNFLGDTNNPGSGASGDINTDGGRAVRAYRISGTVGMSGRGGDSRFGRGGQEQNATNAGGAGSGYGAGGGGGMATSNVNRAGGDGTAGTVIVYEYY